MIPRDLISSLCRDLGLPDHGELKASAVSGGCIHQATRVEIGDRPVFLKSGPASTLAMFQAEAEGLQCLGRTETLRVPAVLACNRTETDAYLALEWLDLRPLSDEGATQLGSGLACLHGCGPHEFGYARDNFIGSATQVNGWSSNWPSFFVKHRLIPQFELCASRGFRWSVQPDVLDHAAQRLAEVDVKPAWLHGDLWGGNAAMTADGQPVIFDPAVYAGHRETDLAMTFLFGGFPDDFYRAYERLLPSGPGQLERRWIYQLYHALNHVYLFGAGYRSLATGLIHRILGRA